MQLSYIFNYLCLYAVHTICTANKPVNGVPQTSLYQKKSQIAINIRTKHTHTHTKHTLSIMSRENERESVWQRIRDTERE